MRKLLLTLLAACAMVAPASAAQAHQTPTPHHNHYSHHQAWGYSNHHSRYDHRRDTIAVIYVDKNFWIETTTVRARDYFLAQGSGPNTAVVPSVHYSLFRDGHYVMSGMTTGGWTAPYVGKNDVSAHTYTYKFSGNSVAQPVRVSLTQ